MLCASNAYFKTGLGITASLGPGATVLNKNAGAFNSGSLRTTSTGVVPGPAAQAAPSTTGAYGQFSGTFGSPWLQRNNERAGNADLGAAGPIPVHHDPTAITGGAFSGFINSQSTGWKAGYPIRYNGTGTLEISYDNGDVAPFPCNMTGYISDPASATHLQIFFSRHTCRCHKHHQQLLCCFRQ